MFRVLADRTHFCRPGHTNWSVTRSFFSPFLSFIISASSSLEIALHAPSDPFRRLADAGCVFRRASSSAPPEMKFPSPCSLIIICQPVSSCFWSLCNGHSWSSPPPRDVLIAPQFVSACPPTISFSSPPPLSWSSLQSLWANFPFFTSGLAHGFSSFQSICYAPLYLFAITIFALECWCELSCLFLSSGRGCDPHVSSGSLSNGWGIGVCATAASSLGQLKQSSSAWAGLQTHADPFYSCRGSAIWEFRYPLLLFPYTAGPCTPKRAFRRCIWPWVGFNWTFRPGSRRRCSFSCSSCEIYLYLLSHLYSPNPIQVWNECLLSNTFTFITTIQVNWNFPDTQIILE